MASFRTACLILGNRADAEEAVQDAYLRAWRFRDSLSGLPSIRPWLYRVVVNSCYSKLRREIPHRDRRAGDEPLAHVPAPGTDPEERAEQGEVAETVLAALQQLPAVAAGPGRPALLRRPERARHRPRHRPPPGHGQVPPARSPPPPGGRPRPVRPGRRRGRTSYRGDRPMTMLDDDRLTSLLAGAAATFEVPGTGAADILERAQRPGPGDDDADDRPDDDPALPGAPGTPGRVHRLVRVAGAPPRALGRRRPRRPAGPGRGGRQLRAQPGAPDGRGRAGAPTGHGARLAPPRPPPRRPCPAGAAGDAPQASAAAPFSTNSGTQGLARNNAPTVTPTTGAPDLPNGAVGQSAKIEQTGSHDVDGRHAAS